MYRGLGAVEDKEQRNKGTDSIEKNMNALYIVKKLLLDDRVRSANV
jgi:hypothetical protein